MQFLSPFRNFDPLNGEITSPFPLVLNNLAYRARKIIKGRTIEEIKFAVLTNNYLFGLSEKGETLETPENKERLRKTIEDWKNIEGYSPPIFVAQYEQGYEPKRSYIPAAQLLLQLLKQSDTADQANFPNAKWSEYFAVLTLSAIGRIISRFEITQIIDEEIGLLISTATEALIIAEAPDLLLPELDKGFRGYMKLKGRESGILRCADIAKSKQEFLDWFIPKYESISDDSEINKTAAAREWIDNVASAADRGSLQRYSNPVRILVDCIPGPPKPRRTH